MHKKSLKRLRQLVFQECAVMMAIPMLLNTVSLTSASILGTITANTLGDFTDAAFSLNLSLGLEKILRLAVYVLLAVLVIPGVNLLSDYVMLTYALRHDNIVFSHYLDKDPEKAMAMDLGEVQYQLEDAPNMMRIYWVNIFGRIIATPISLLFLLYWSGQISWGLTGLVFLLCALKLTAPLFFMEKLAGYDREEKHYLAKRRNCESDIAGMPHLIALWQTKKSHLARLQTLFRSYYQKTAANQIICKVFSQQTKELLDQLILVLLLLGGSILISTGRMSPGGLATMMVYLTVIQSALNDIGSIVQQFPLLKNEANRVCEFYTDTEAVSGETIGHFTGLYGKKMSFSYPDRPVFHDFDFSIKPGEKVALQGPNGCGKSTLIKIICMLLKSYQGTIQAGNISLKEIHTADWRELIAYAPQNPMLFSATVRENIAMANPSASPKTVDKFMEDFGILALGDRVLSEQSALSGGERQKVSIIRAMLKEAEFLILDEPSNHLDPASIEVLKKWLLKTDKTVLLVSHDPLLLDTVDRVISMQNQA